MARLNNHQCCVFLGDALANYGFGSDHPFSTQRHDVFLKAFLEQQLDKKVDVLEPTTTNQQTLELFHTHDYVEKVRHQSILGKGYLDQGDTPAFAGMYEAASAVAGTVCHAADLIMTDKYQRAFIPIAGLHHARRHIAAGFCVFNDCGIVIEYLRHQHKIQRIAYVDIDAHHGDGVFYSFEDDPNLIFVDVHEDGHYLYPGTGDTLETGKGTAMGSKLNIPVPPQANDELFRKLWPTIESFLRKFQPEFILLQCGADSIAGDPITHMAYSEASHAFASTQLCKLANEVCGGRLIAMGGGGYNHTNIASAWTAVVRALSSC